MNAITEYFSGEKLQCLIGIAISVVFIGLALYFLLQVKTPLTTGIAWPFLLIPALLFFVCIGIVLRTSQDIERVSQYVNQEPGKIASEEIPRMEKVIKNFKVIKIVELCLLGIGLGLVLFGAIKGADLLKGIGIGLAIQSAVMYGFDYFAHARGDQYFEYLQNL